LDNCLTDCSLREFRYRFRCRNKKVVFAQHLINDEIFVGKLTSIDSADDADNLNGTCEAHRAEVYTEESSVVDRVNIGVGV